MSGFLLGVMTRVAFPSENLPFRVLLHDRHHDAFVNVEIRFAA